MSHNGSTPRIHVAELWGGSGKSSVTLKHDRSMNAWRWGGEACSCRAAGGRARARTSPRSRTQTAGPGSEGQVNGFASRWGQNALGCSRGNTSGPARGGVMVGWWGWGTEAQRGQSRFCSRDAASWLFWGASIRCNSNHCKKKQSLSCGGRLRLQKSTQKQKGFV